MSAKNATNILKKIDDEIKHAVKNEKKLLENKVLTNGTKRVLIAGMSGAGKTYSLITLFNYLHQPDAVFIYSRTALKNMGTLKAALSQFEVPVKERTFEEIVKKGLPYVRFLEDCPTPQTLKENRDNFLAMDHSIFIFDDCLDAELKKNVVGFYTFGRNFNLSTILLFQRYSHVPVKIRNNSNLLFIFRSEGAYQHIWPDVKLYFDNKQQFDALCKLLNRKEMTHRFISIDKQAFENPVRINIEGIISYEKLDDGRYRIIVDFAGERHVFEP